MSELVIRDDITILIPFAGSSNRAMVSKIDQIVNGLTILEHTLLRFTNVLNSKVILILPNDKLESYSYLGNEKVKLIEGGTTRSQSVLNGLQKVDTKYVLIHDGARPLLSRSDLLNVINFSSNYTSSVLYTTQVDALYQINDGLLLNIDKKKYINVLTPQVFETKLLLACFDEIILDYADELSLFIKHYPINQIQLVKSLDINIKYTFPQDLQLIKRYLNKKEVLVGQSFDIHQLVRDRKLYLGGLLIESEYGLLGHSDGDCVLHSIVDCIFGGLNKGDLGSNFGVDREEYKDVNSKIFLEKALNLLKENNYYIINMDIQLILDNPRLSPLYSSIKDSIASIARINPNIISIRSTTTKGIKLSKDDKSIGCLAVVTIGENDY